MSKGLLGFIVGMLALSGVLGLIGWLIYVDINDYRRQCHRAGGHVVSVRNEEVCVNHDNQVIFI